MSDKTKISWTDASWNPIRGCMVVSPGCTNCYAMEVAARFSGPGLPYEGLARRTKDGKAVWTGEAMLVESHLNDPIRWQKPRRIFVNSMSDVFFEQIPDSYIDRMFTVMETAKRHIFQILTKRPERMRDYMKQRVESIYPPDVFQSKTPGEFYALTQPHIWLGVSVEDQVRADQRIPILLDTPAAVRFLSCEPMLSGLDLREWLGGGSQDENRRDGGISDGGDRPSDDRRRRSGMAASGIDEREQHRRSGSPVYPEESRYGQVEEGRVSPYPGDGRHGAVRGRSASDCMDGRQSADDPGGPRSKSQKRDQGHKQAVQSGVDDTSREHGPFVAHARKSTEAVEIQTGTGTSPGDPPPTRPEDFEPYTGSSDVWSERRNGERYREARQVDLAPRINWVITGGESGRNHRPDDQDWYRSIRDQCREAGVAYFHKQSAGPKSGTGVELDGVIYHDFPLTQEEPKNADAHTLDPAFDEVRRLTAVWLEERKGS